MASPRMGFTATLLPNGKVLVAGGIGSSGGLLDTAEVYDPASERFVAVAAPMTSARWLHCAVGLPDGKVLLAGGRQPGASIESPEVALASAEIYDPTSGTFTATGSMSSGRHSPMVVLLPNKKVLVTGGRADLRDLVTAELYDPNSGRFASAGRQTRIQSAAVLLLDGNVLLAGGNGPAEIYNSSTGSFSDTSAMGTARQNFGAVLLESGRALVAGGADATVGPSVYLASALLYDPGAGTFASTGSMRTARSQFSATVLKSGNVLVAGGLGNASSSESAEIYAPETGAFTATAHLTTGRNNHTATLLLDGRVLLLGGSSDAANAELFEP